MKYEFLGVIGTLLILVGFLSDDQRTIRIFDMVGSLFFVVYGITIASFSTILLNGTLALVHIYKLAAKE